VAGEDLDELAGRSRGKFAIKGIDFFIGKVATRICQHHLGDGALFNEDRKYSHRSFDIDR